MKNQHRHGAFFAAAFCYYVNFFFCPPGQIVLTEDRSFNLTVNRINTWILDLNLFENDLLSLSADSFRDKINCKDSNLLVLVENW